MTAGLIWQPEIWPNGVDRRDHGQPEGERDPEDPNAELRNRGAQKRAPAAGEHQPERAERFGGQSLSHQCLPCQWILPALCPAARQSASGGWPRGETCRGIRLRLTVCLPTPD